MTRPLTILWEDPHGLAVAKPAGCLTQAAGPGRDEGEGEVAGGPTLEALVRAYLRPDDPASAYLGTVHRLDRPVSGVVLWAKTPKAARRWADQFAGRSVRKEYWAIVEVGPIADLAGTVGIWDDHLASPDARGRARVVEAGTTGGLRALTRSEVGAGRALPAGLAWLRLRPETGRTHQLRAQSAARGLPILGDAAYGATRAFPRGIALHARRLEVEHPISKRPVAIEAPLPESWDGWLT